MDPSGFRDITDQNITLIDALYNESCIFQKFVFRLNEYAGFLSSLSCLSFAIKYREHWTATTENQENRNHNQNTYVAAMYTWLIG